MLGSRHSDDVAPRLHRRGPEGSVRFCGREMALDVESDVSGCGGVVTLLVGLPFRDFSRNH